MRRAGDPDEKPLQALGVSGENTLRYDDARRGCAFSKVTRLDSKVELILARMLATILFAIRIRTRMPLPEMNWTMGRSDMVIDATTSTMLFAIGNVFRFWLIIYPQDILEFLHSDNGRFAFLTSFLFSYCLLASIFFASRVESIDGKSVRLRQCFILRKQYPLSDVQLARVVLRAFYVFRCVDTKHVIWNHRGGGATELVAAISRLSPK